MSTLAVPTAPRHDGLEAALDDCPHDWASRRVYADWLEERGLAHRARVQRWMADNQKRPGNYNDWSWNDEETHKISGLSQELLQLLGFIEGFRRLNRVTVMSFESRYDAEDALADALRLFWCLTSFERDVMLWRNHGLPWKMVAGFMKTTVGKVRYWERKAKAKLARVE